MSTPAPETLPSPFIAGLLCRCPRCGKGHLFRGYLGINPVCEVCGLDLKFADSGDGPAIFIIFIVGFIIMAAAGIVEAVFHPPAFVHLLLWIPSTIILCLVLLRPFKATMVALQYQNRAAEGRRIDG